MELERRAKTGGITASVGSILRLRREVGGCIDRVFSCDTAGYIKGWRAAVSIVPYFTQTCTSVDF